MSQSRVHDVTKTAPTSGELHWTWMVNKENQTCCQPSYVMTCSDNGHTISGGKDDTTDCKRLKTIISVNCFQMVVVLQLLRGGNWKDVGISAVSTKVLMALTNPCTWSHQRLLLITP